MAHPNQLPQKNGYRIHRPRLHKDARKTWCGLWIRWVKSSNDPDKTTCKNCLRLKREYFKRKPNMNVEKKEYLGDAVYASQHRGMLKLTTEDGVEETNTIYLEPEVYEALVRYAERTFGKQETST